MYRIKVKISNRNCHRGIVELEIKPTGFSLYLFLFQNLIFLITTTYSIHDL